MNAKNFFHALRGMINAMHLYALPSVACNSCAQATSLSWLRHWLWLCTQCYSGDRFTACSLQWWKSLWTPVFTYITSVL